MGTRTLSIYAVVNRFAVMVIPEERDEAGIPDLLQPSAHQRVLIRAAVENGVLVEIGGRYDRDDAGQMGRRGACGEKPRDAESRRAEHPDPSVRPAPGRQPLHRVVSVSVNAPSIRKVHGIHAFGGVAAAGVLNGDRVLHDVREQGQHPRVHADLFTVRGAHQDAGKLVQ
jgi:hypothetical protein